MNHATRILPPKPTNNLPETAEKVPKPTEEKTNIVLMGTCNKIESSEQRKKLIDNCEIFVLKFGAEWCGPCKKCEPDFKKMAVELGDSKCIFATEDVDDDNGDYDCEINSIPLFCIYLNGKLYQQINGTKIDIVKNTIINLKKIIKKNNM